MRPELVNVTRLGVERAALAADDLVLRNGAEVVVRVLAASGLAGGRGLISLAGRHLRAELPAGLTPGQRLRVTIEAESPERIVLRIVGRGGDGPAEGGRGLQGALVLSGNGELARAGFMLAGTEGAVALPGGGEAALIVDPDDGTSSGTDGPQEQAIVTLQSPELGPIRVTLTLTPSGIGAVVAVEPGQAEELARAGRPALVDALARATQRPAAVTIAPRAPEEPRPAPILPADWIDVHA